MGEIGFTMFNPDSTITAIPVRTTTLARDTHLRFVGSGGEGEWLVRLACVSGVLG